MHLQFQFPRQAQDLVGLGRGAGRGPRARLRGYLAAQLELCDVGREPYDLAQQVGEVALLAVEQVADLVGNCARSGELRSGLDPDRIGVAVAQPQEAVGDVVVEVVAPNASLPALLEQPEVVLHVARAAPARHRFQMRYDAGRAVVHLMTAVANAKAEVDVLERIAKVRVEAAGTVESLAPHEHARGRHCLERARLLDRGMIAREAGIEVARAPVLADHDSSVLHGAVRKQQLGAHDRGLGMSVGVVSERVEPALVRLGVVVEEHQQVAARRRGAVVAGGREAAAALTTQRAHRIGLTSQQLRGLVLGGIVDDDDLELRPRRRGENRLQAAAGEARAPMHRDHDRAPRPGHGCRPLSAKMTQTCSSRTIAS